MDLINHDDKHGIHNSYEYNQRNVPDLNVITASNRLLQTSAVGSRTSIAIIGVQIISSPAFFSKHPET